MITELSAWLCACAARSPSVLADCTHSIVKISRSCDDAAKVLPSTTKLDADLLGWPGLVTKRNQLSNAILRKYVLLILISRKILPQNSFTGLKIIAEIRPVQ